LPEELQPVFETKFRRRSVLVEWADASGLPARIEVAIDEGTVLAGGRKMPIRELELELKEGDPRALFELVAAMRAIVPLRFYPLDKAARGYMLAKESPPHWRKASPLLLAPDMTVEDALATILGSATRHWIDNEAAAVDARDSEGLHQLRVALRRIRSALNLFRPALPEASRKQWDGELKWLLSHLGTARDLDVFVGETLPPLRDVRSQDPALAALREAAQRRRKEGHDELRATVDSHRYADLLFGFSIWTARRGWRQGAEFETLLIQRQPIEQLARVILRKRHRAVLKAGTGFESLDAEHRHKVRIAFKKLRYGLEFFDSLFPEKDVRRFKKHAAAMQDLLGHMNDAVVADRLVHDLVQHRWNAIDPVQVAIGGGQVMGWYAKKLQDEEGVAIAAWNSFVAQEPFWKER
jgi:inorganic triphosphatase YgiF